MALYTRQQLVLLLALLGAAGVGLALERWRHAYPEMAERIEQFDRAPTPADGEPPRAAEPRPTLRPARREPTARPAAKLDAVPAAPVDVNTASREELRRLPGVGPTLAARIVEARGTAGGFGSVEDLRRVRGLGGARLDRLRPFVAVAHAPPDR